MRTANARELRLHLDMRLSIPVRIGITKKLVHFTYLVTGEKVAHGVPTAVLLYTRMAECLGKVFNVHLVVVHPKPATGLMITNFTHLMSANNFFNVVRVQPHNFKTVQMDYYSTVMAVIGLTTSTAGFK